MRLTELIDDFLEYCHLTKKLQPATVKNYESYLTKFAKSVGNINPSQVTLTLVEKFKEDLSKNRTPDGQFLDLKTRNYYLIALRSFLKFLRKEKIQTLEPTKIKLFKTQRASPSFLDDEEIEKFLKTVQTEKSPTIRQRDGAILGVLIETGLTVSELINLKKENFNQQRKTLMAQKNQQRRFQLSEQTTQALREYLIRRKDESPFLFYREGRQLKMDETQGLTSRTIQRIIKKYQLMSQINKDITPHTLRHSFAKKKMDQGLTIKEIKKMLGYKNPLSPSVYQKEKEGRRKLLY